MVEIRKKSVADVNEKTETTKEKNAGGKHMWGCLEVGVFVN